MRILMLSPSPEVRGPIPKHTAYLVEALRRLGADVTMMTWGRHSDQETLSDKLKGRARDIYRVRDMLLQERFDVLVVKTSHDWMTLSRDIPLVAATRHLVPSIVLQFHGSLPNRLVGPGAPLFKMATSLLLSMVDGAMVLSTEEQTQWQAFYPGLPFYTVSNPFVSIGVKGKTEPPFQVTTGEPVVLYVGRLIEAKGLIELIEAFQLAVATHPAHLVIVGEGELRTHLQELCKAHGLTGKVTFTGYLEGDKLQAAYASAGIFVLPSWSEGFPFSIVEAMDAGLPIITTRIRGMADHLREGLNALFVPIRHPRALASTLTQLLVNAPLRTIMGQNNQQKVREFYPNVVGQHYLTVLEQITGRKNVGLK